MTWKNDSGRGETCPKIIDNGLWYLYYIIKYPNGGILNLQVEPAQTESWEKLIQQYVRMD